MLTQQACSLVQAYVTYEVGSRDARYLFYLAVELASADAHLGTELVHLELAVADVLVYGLHDAVHQFVVVRLNLDVLNLTLLCLNTAELTA